jgi:hypothetical protein
MTDTKSLIVLREIQDSLDRIERLLLLSVPVGSRETLEAEKNRALFEKWARELKVWGLEPNDFDLTTRPWRT